MEIDASGWTSNVLHGIDSGYIVCSCLFNLAFALMRDDAGKGRDATAPMQSLAEVSQLVAFREKEQLGRDGLSMSFSNTFSFKDLNF